MAFYPNSAHIPSAAISPGKTLAENFVTSFHQPRIHMTVASAPTVVRADYLSVIYLPPGNRTPRDVAEANMQLIVGTQATPMVKVVPPTRRVLPVAVEDRVVFALPPERISGENGSIEAQEALDPYLYGIGHTLRCGFRTGQVPPQTYLQSLAPQIAQHLRDHYPVRERQRQRD